MPINKGTMRTLIAIFLITQVMNIESSQAISVGIAAGIKCDDVFRDSQYLVAESPLNEIIKLGNGHKWFGGHVYLLHPGTSQEFVRKVYASETMARMDHDAMIDLEKIFNEADEDFGFVVNPVRNWDGGKVMDLDYTEGLLIEDLDESNKAHKAILDQYTKAIESFANYMYVKEGRRYSFENYLLDYVREKRSVWIEYTDLETGIAHEFWLKADNILYVMGVGFVIFDPN